MKINLPEPVMLPVSKKQRLEFVIDHKAERQHNVAPRIELYNSVADLAGGLHNYDFLCQIPSWDPYDDDCDVDAQKEMDELLNEMQRKVLFHEFEEYYVYSRYKSPYFKAFSTGIKAYSNGVDISNCPYQRETYKNIWAEGWDYAKTGHENAVSNIKFWGQGNAA